MTKKDVIEKFTLLKGVGTSKAELLYNSGFDSLDKLKKASIADLEKIKGLNKNIAKDIINQLKKETKTTTDKKQVKPAVSTDKKNILIETSKEEKKKRDSEIDEKEEVYTVKKKPNLSKEQKESLTIRKQIKKRTPNFLREEWFRYKKIPRNWRRPDGITSKMRINLKYRPSKVRIGFRGPKKVRGLHPSGYEEISIFNVNDLENIDSKTQAIRIGSTVGTKKRIDIEKKAEELNIRILNM